MNEVIDMEQPTQKAVVAAPQSSIATVTPADLLRHALDSGADLDRLEKLMDLQERWEANEARKAYADAMTEFKRNPPTIIKDKRVSFKSGSGQTQYDHATIGNVTGSIIASLAQHGFSHSWSTEQRDGLVIVTCIITHRQGHSERVMLMSSPDTSGGKNSIQSIISAQTYLQRHSLLAATGLATNDQVDNDGAPPEPPAAPESTRAKPIIAGGRFAKAVSSVKTGDYTIEKIRQQFELTVDQQTALSDLEAELARAAKC